MIKMTATETKEPVWICVKTQTKREHIAAGYLKRLPESDRGRILMNLMGTDISTEVSLDILEKVA